MNVSRLAIVVGRAQGSDPARHRAAPPAVEDGTAVDATTTTWPFRRHVTPVDPAPRPGRIYLPRLHRAFPAGQTGGTRLVLTQATYQLQRWLDWLDVHPTVSVAGDMASATPMQTRDAFARRGPWARVAIEPVAFRAPSLDDEDGAADPMDALHAAFEGSDPEERWRQSRRLAFDFPSNPALHLAHASACLELQRLDDAHDALGRAVSLSPDWEAVYFELGKAWLRSDDTERAAAAFAEAGRIMPTFSAAFSNLGAALGELHRHEEALAALQQALAFNPYGHTILNNIGAAARDLGRLDEAESAFRQAVAHAPQFVFGHYNLGHTFFLQGRFVEARQAYEEGLAADRQPSPRQRCRAALAHAATGDQARAAEMFRAALGETEGEARSELINESAAVLRALQPLPGIDGWAILQLLELLDRG